MGYQTRHHSNSQAASCGRSPLKAASFEARLRRGAPVRRDTSSILVWATRLATTPTRKPRPADAALSRRLPLKRGFAAARLCGATRVRFSYGLPDSPPLQLASRVLRTQPSQGGFL